MQDDPGAPRNGQERPCVLVAEDNPTNRYVVTHFLHRIGLTHEFREDGAATILAWESGRFGLVLMDIEMPVMDGYAAAREIRRREAVLGRRPTPIIALSANALPASQETARASGMDDLVTKPVALEQLRRAIERALSDG